ncbi:MAG: MFS transporter, partial [Alphaproteobacteria bacterium]|nr:MFS transporter [Alphaproteobacteria bacterium]
MCDGYDVGSIGWAVPSLTHAWGIAPSAFALAFLWSNLGVMAGALLSGPLGDRFGRKPVLLAGWLIGVPVPLLIMAAPSWGWIVAANILLGVNQGFAWSMTVVMKIDL